MKTEVATLWLRPLTPTDYFIAVYTGIEPVPLDRQSSILAFGPINLVVFKWRCRNSNPKPTACKAVAHPLELHPHNL